jgi:succinate dehydrogenase / fumarate reductase cytochrome b subunit
MISLRTPLGRKNLEALSGVFLLLFLVEHLIANTLLLLSDPEPYRWYTSSVGASIFVRILEVVLFVLFITHIVVGLVMRLHHRQIQRRNPKLPKPKNFSTRFIGYTGVIILIFLIIHLLRFFIPNRVLETKGFDLYTEAHAAFASLPYTVFYAVSMLALASHLRHGIRSSLFSFRFIPREYIARIKTIASWMGFIVPLGLAGIALWLFVVGNLM